MHLPDRFAWTDHAELLAHLRAHPFATVCTAAVDGGVEAQHVPLLAEVVDGRVVLAGHVARANPLWRAPRVLAVFHGPHAYVSAAWYGEADTVPTWNYQVVHASGALTPIEDASEVRRLFTRMGEQLDGAQAAQWWATLGEAAYARLAAAIAWFRIDVELLIGKAKLSQHHPVERRRRVIAALRAAGGDHNAAVAAAMERTLT